MDPYVFINILPSAIERISSFFVPLYPLENPMCPTTRHPPHGEGESEGSSLFWFFSHRTTPMAIGGVAYFESAKVLLTFFFVIFYLPNSLEDSINSVIDPRGIRFSRAGDIQDFGLDVGYPVSDQLNRLPGGY